MNVNRFLENSKRTSLIGRNIYTSEGFHRDGRWDAPKLGLPGRLLIGHELFLESAVTVELSENGRAAALSPVRHRWTPAWIESYYRSAPDAAYYPNAGCLAVRERKCFTVGDVFVARIELRNDRRETVRVGVKLGLPFEGGKVHCPAQAGALGSPLTVDGYVALRTDRGDGRAFTAEVPSQGEAAFSIAFAFSKESAARAEAAALDALQIIDPFGEKERAFNRFIAENAPEMRCDEPDMLRAYYYRWFLIYRALHCPSEVIDGHPVEGDCLYESPYGAWYDCPVGLPVPLHLEETKWMRRPDVPFADADNWLKGLTCYQGFGYIQYTPMAMWHLYLQHPDQAFLARAYPECHRYALAPFHPEREGLAFLPTLDSSWPTGAEYQPAFYQHTRTPWDWTQDNEGRSQGIADEELKLYRIDYVCYSTGNLIGCANMARALGRAEEADELQSLADRAIDLLRTRFWHDKTRRFVSLDAKSRLPCDEATCYDSFFPFLWGMVGEEFRDGWSPLFDREALACDFSLTTVDRRCPMYWFDNCVAGPAKSSTLRPHAYGCCWNGPVWPYAVSGVAEALGGAARTDEALRARWLALFEAYTELHFMQGDRSVPMITEHYRPTDGVSFSEVCDYFHSTWIDLFMKYWAGIRAEANGIAFEPYAECEFELRHVCVGGRSYTVKQFAEDGKLKRIIINE